MSETTTLTLAAVLENSSRRFAQRPALSFVAGTPLTYAELGEESARVRAALRARGVRPGDRVGILAGNMPNWGVAYFAVTSMGAVAVPLLPDFHEREIATFLAHAGCDALFVSDKLFDRVRDAALPTLRLRIRLEDMNILNPAGEVVEPLWTPAHGSVPAADVTEDDLASIIYTSGTTGKSKGVMLTHRNIAFNALKVQTIQPVCSEDVFLSILPLSHTYENTLGLILPIMQGAAVYYIEKPPTAAVLLPALEQVRPTLMLSVPLVIEKIHKMRVLPRLTKNGLLRRIHATEKGRRLLYRMAGKQLMKTFGGRLHFFGIGGAKLDPVVERFLRDAKFPYAIGYGLTETAPLLAGANPHVVRFQSTGPAMEGVDLRIADADPLTGEGEIQARGPSVMRGYYNEPELTREAFTEDGWFRTGDLGVFDADGHLSIKGRLKNMIVGSAGENIYPEEIESVINTHRYVLESLVLQSKGRLVAKVHLNYEEIEAQFAHLRDEAVQYVQQRVEEILRELHAQVNARVNRFSQLAAVVEQRDPFEKTATQKIKRFLHQTA
ncbi:MAG: AMP-binding protein [Bacteroidota bacterium]|jgi:long-chain acyl-CoA synthetase|nr:AMP-binding protein [Bacteroidota bacterium]